MKTLIDQNREFLQARFPGVWEAFLAATPLPSPLLGDFVIPFPASRKIALPVEPRVYVEEHRRQLETIGNFSGALIWGVGSPEELELYWQAVAPAPGRPFHYIESDPVVFGRLVRGVALEKYFSEAGSRISFAGDCGQFMAEIAIAFGDESQVLSRIFVTVEPSLFSKLLTDEHPLGQFVDFILINVFLNQSEDEKNRGSKLANAGVAIQEVFPPTYLYHSIQRFLKLFVIASPGIRTLYREKTALVDPASVYPLSIVILAWNRWDLTERCLRSIFSFPLPPNTEILVVDNGSTDLTPVALKRFAEKIPYLRTLKLPKNMGPAGGRDAALPATKGKTMVFLDNDVEIKHARWLDILIEPILQHPRVGASGAFGVIHTHDETETWYQKVLFPGLTVPSAWLSSFCVAFRRQALIDCGGWRPDLYPLYGMEDVSIGWALREAGWIAAVPGQFVPINHGMKHRDGHYDYDIEDSGRKNTENFTRLWGPKRRILNLAKSNQTLAMLGSTQRGCVPLPRAEVDSFLQVGIPR